MIDFNGSSEFVPAFLVLRVKKKTEETTGMQKKLPLHVQVQLRLAT